MSTTSARSGVASVLAGSVSETVAEATGQTHRSDPELPGTGGPAGNARLTAWTGLVLLVLFLAELVTLLDMHGWITWHIVLGTVLVPPALLKTATTSWRIARYYRRDPAYQQAGPPPMLLRLLGPAVVASTLGVLATGLLLVWLGPGSSRTSIIDAPGLRVDWVTLHQGMFVLWAASTGLHVLGRLVPALRLTLTRGAAVAGRPRRAWTLVVTLLVAVLAGALVLSGTSSWSSAAGRHHDRPGFNGVNGPPPRH